VLGAMETMYQRGKIQEESLYYEHKKHDGELPIIGVNTFLPAKRNEDELRAAELIRSTEAEKQDAGGLGAGLQRAPAPTASPLRSSACSRSRRPAATSSSS
jgi:isobutyryl-CoA mutase